MRLTYKYIGDWPTNPRDLQKGDMSKVVEVEIKEDEGLVVLHIEFVRAEAEQ